MDVVRAIEKNPTANGDKPKKEVKIEKSYSLKSPEDFEAFKTEKKPSPE